MADEDRVTCKTVKGWTFKMRIFHDGGNLAFSSRGPVVRDGPDKPWRFDREQGDGVVIVDETDK